MKRTTEEIVLLVSIIALAVPCLFFSVKHVLAADAKFCGVVYRDAITKNILRSTAVKNKFKKEWACNLPCNPLTWQIDHIVPLSVGGCDTVDNMQWLPIGLKTCQGALCKDRWEQRVYGGYPITTIYIDRK
jgi:hypothetical protein